MLRPFTVHQPPSMAEALALRASLGDDAVPYAGGTELILAMKLGLGHWPHLIDVKRIPDLAGIEMGEGVIRIGAAATHRAIARDPQVQHHVPALAGLEDRIANVRVRATGTLGGNLAFAEPHADPPALLLALGSRVVLHGPEGQRRLGLGDFLTGAYETRLGPAELVAGIEIRIPPPGTRAAYLNFKVLERPSIGVAAVGQIEEGRFRGQPTVVVGAVEDVPRLVPTAGVAGAGPDDGDALRAVAEGARHEVSPVDDLAGTAVYKRHVTGVLVSRVLSALLRGG